MLWLSLVMMGQQAAAPRALSPRDLAGEYGLMPAPETRTGWTRPQTIRRFPTIAAPDVGGAGPAPAPAAKEAAPQFDGIYKGELVSVIGAPDFYYVRSDHFARLGGDVTMIRTFGTFGPFPAGSTVRVRKGMPYNFILFCPAPRSTQVAISTDASLQHLAMICAGR